MKKLLAYLILICISNMAFAAEDNSTYCTMLNKIQPGMKIREVFLLLGPPNTFGAPPNLNMDQVMKKASAMSPPQDKIADQTSQEQMMIKIVDSDPIMQAFINSSSDTTNVLIWQFEGNKFNISVKIKGPVVTDVNSNLSC